MAAPADNPANAQVMRRLNSPERARAIEEMNRIDAAAREAYAQSETAASVLTAPSASPVRHSRAGGNDGSESRPQSVGEVLFNYAAGFAGVPGLAPRQGVDGSLDEGLGFHQDGTARKAGGVAGSSGPSDRGQRASAYMRTGLQNGYGMAGYNAGLYDEMHYDVWGRNDPTRGGRVTANSRELGDFDPMNMAIDRGLNWGAGFVNSMGEAAISGLVDGGRARLNFRLDRDGYFSGEGDALLPFWDSRHSTAFVQFGARSMHDSSDTRWIGNLGLGQRWFPNATEDDSGNWMVGYNAFFDYDLTRDHQRGGIGAELQYDWLRLASNYYFPLSSWRGSEDFDSRFVKERPAEGWDVRAKGYLPFYRNVAITGAYSQWYGDHVGMFGADRLEKDPKVWSYGIEYTPVPLVSGFITQKSTERGRSDTEFGLTFTYHFGMPWEDQTSHGKVAELRTVSGSRHEFVDRENRIILEYKARNAFRIEYLGKVGTNTFKFRIMDGLGKAGSGKTVQVAATGAAFASGAGSASFTTNGGGDFIVALDTVTASPVTLTIQAGNSTQSFSLTDVELTAFSLAASGSLTQGTAGSLTLTLTRGSVAQSGVSVTVQGNATEITGLPANPVSTDASGQILLDNLTVLVPTNLTLSAVVDGETLAVPVTVIPGAYTVTASPDTLTQNTPTNVTFTVKQGGITVGSGVAVTFTSNGNFSNLPTGEQQTNASGQIVMNGLAVTAASEQTLEAAIDGKTVSVVISVTASSLSISPASLSVATVGDAYNEQLTVSGGSGSYTYAVTVGSLPDGLSLNTSSGVLSGTPTTSGSPTFTIEVTDSNNPLLKASQQFTLTVSAATPNYTLPNAISVTTSGTIYADGVSEHVVQVQVYDSANSANAGAGVTVTWSVTSSPSTGITLENGGASTTNAQGVAVMRITDGNGDDSSVTVKAVVDGGGTNKEQSQTVNFAALPYTLAPQNSPTLAVGLTQEARFILRQNGSPVANTSVTLSYSGSGAFDSPPALTSTDGSGVFSLSLKGQTAGSVTITVTLPNNKTAECTVTILAASYSLSLSASNANPGTSGSSDLTATLTNHGQTVSGQNVVFTWGIKGGTVSGQTGATSATNGSGVATWTLTNSSLDSHGGHRTITVTATVSGVTPVTTEVRFGDLTNSNFIAASGGYMDWGDAQTYCTAQGGHLPQINGEGSQSYAQVITAGSANIEGFGIVVTTDGGGTTSWPSGLPAASYWTGTEVGDVTGDSWVVGAGGGNVHVDRAVQGNPVYRALCVP